MKKRLKSAKKAVEFLKIGFPPTSEEINCLDDAICALEIIQEKNVDIALLKGSNKVYDYNNAIEYELYYKKLAEEEFNKLKEYFV